MTAHRLTSEMLAKALMRLAGRDGGFAAILARGDPGAGAILLQILEKGCLSGLYERLLDARGEYGWAPVGPPGADKEGVSDYLDKRRLGDPDLWIVELDIPDAERFIAEILPNP